MAFFGVLDSKPHLLQTPGNAEQIWAQNLLCSGVWKPMWAPLILVEEWGPVWMVGAG